ncbi:Dihydrolipoyl dehydrogenase [Pelagimonas phthalicica]|uniref:Dihydrolipoyl dehydrogenase n=1 Tax=Pelagimonas phthalicica TaxID=1037362 RepID=A0A238JFM7_9RHOB|nr:FAD-dependent oxidoreductase [Pelagimonas phthalicica]SMX29215.1 Dihydrolipoyl dehydrogenase [Pelagimonas phthalicica]
MKTKTCALLIIGAGPGGYVCGIRAAQLGVDTIVVEGDKPGGTCLNVGCIPSKALIHAADEFAKAQTFSGKNDLGISTTAPKIDLAKTMAWKDSIVKRLTGGVSSLLKKAKARTVSGQARILDGKTVEVSTRKGPVRIACQNMVIATGSGPFELPFLPFGGSVISSTEALDLQDVPQNLAIVGGGYIGLEIGTAMAKLGASVTVVEAADRILPQYDPELTKPVMAQLKALGITVHLSTTAKGMSKNGSALLADTESGALEIPADTVLVTVGRSPKLQGFGLEDLNLTMSGSFIAVDTHCATSMRGVFAIGDVTGDPMLAHRAMAQGVIVAEHIAGLPSVWDKRAMPAVCFTDPEIVAVGALPDEIDGTKTALFPFCSEWSLHDDGTQRWFCSYCV